MKVMPLDQIGWLTVHGVKKKKEYMPMDTHIMQTYLKISNNCQLLDTAYIKKRNEGLANVNYLYKKDFMTNSLPTLKQAKRGCRLSSVQTDSANWTRVFTAKVKKTKPLF